MPFLFCCVFLSHLPEVSKSGLARREVVTRNFPCWTAPTEICTWPSLEHIACQPITLQPNTLVLGCTILFRKKILATLVKSKIKCLNQMWRFDVWCLMSKISQMSRSDVSIQSLSETSGPRCSPHSWSTPGKTMSTRQCFAINKAVGGWAVENHVYVH